ncbi:hypothetical protein JCM11251_002164 [Rhodosporidiobolus azoricus]
MPTHMSLAEAHAELEIPEGSSADQVRLAFKRLSLQHHPDKNPSPEATAKFQRISESYQRIVNPEPAFSSGGGFGGGMGGFPMGAFGFGMGGGTFFFSTGRGGYGFGGGRRGYYDDDNDEEEYEEEYDYDDDHDEDEEEEDDSEDFDDYTRFVFEDVMGGGYGSRSSYQSYRKHTAQDQPPETAEERAGRMKAEAERIKRAEELRKNEAKWTKEEREKAQAEESRAAASRRSQKKAAQSASKSAASTAAALAALKRLQLAQLRRSAVFAALRKGDGEAVKKGVYEEDVDPAGGEWLDGGREALNGLGQEERVAMEADFDKKGGGETGGKANAAMQGKKAAAPTVAPGPVPAPSKGRKATPSTPITASGGGKKKNNKGGKGSGKKDDKADADDDFWATLSAEAVKNQASAPPPPAQGSYTASNTGMNATGGWGQSTFSLGDATKSAHVDNDEDDDDDDDDDDLPPLVDDHGAAASVPASTGSSPTAPPKVNAPYSPKMAPPSPTFASESPEVVSKSKRKRMKKKKGAAVVEQQEQQEEVGNNKEEEEKETIATPPQPSSAKGKSKRKKGGAASAATAGGTAQAVSSAPSSPEVDTSSFTATSGTASPTTGRTRSAPQKPQQLESDPKETLLHLAAKLGKVDLVEWLVDHGANPEERDSDRATAFHQALFRAHAPTISFFIDSSPPPFPAPHGPDLASYHPDAYYPLPHRQRSLLSIALSAAHTKAKGAKKTWEAVKLVLPFSSGHDLKEGWKKVEFEGRRAKTDQEWEVFEEIKWSLAERAKELDFDGFTPNEEYLRRRRPPVRI